MVALIRWLVGGVCWAAMLLFVFAIAMAARASFPVRLVRCATLVDEVSGEA